MRGLPARHYTSSTIFAKERSEIFERLWLFAGLKMMIARRGAYHARTLAGIPIVLQNLGGQLCCFRNVCPHRGGPLQLDGFGVRGLVCGYHGFRYDAQGEIATIPMGDTHYRFSPDERSCLKLERIALVEVGQLLFVNFASSPPPIEAQFSEALLAQLTSMSTYFDTEVIHAVSMSHYNWKLPGENLRDQLHPRFVHPESLYPFFDFEAQGIEPRPLERAVPGMRDVSFGGPEGYPKATSPWPYWEALERWPDASEHYYNWLLFPNLHIASPDGCRTFGIEQYDPVSVDRTALVHYMLTTRRKTSIEHGDALLRGMMRSAARVLAEDRKVMEDVQRGLAYSELTPTLGTHETDLARFLQVGRSCIDG